MNSPAKVATLLCFCSRSRSPWQTAWIQSSCFQMKPLLLPGVTGVCQLLGCQLRTLPSWPPVSVGRSSLTHSNRASEVARHRSERGVAGIERVWISNYINLRGTKYVHKHICLCALFPQEVSWYDGATIPRESLPEKVIPLLEPLLGRNTIKTGRWVLKW